MPNEDRWSQRQFAHSVCEEVAGCPEASARRGLAPALIWPHHTLAMKPQFVADGEMRLKQSPEFQAKLRALRESIHACYAAELSSADFFRRCLLRWRIAMEYRRERRHIVPSSQSLYGSGIVNGSPHEWNQPSQTEKERNLISHDRIRMLQSFECSNAIFKRDRNPFVSG